jgi:prepilin-type N-terminal cleavage/methylation domain-containing protein
LLDRRLVQAPTIRPVRAAAPAATLCARVRGRRHLQAGFTLVELMVVVVLIAVLAMIAAPALRVSRDDRMAFDYARQIQQMSSRAHTRASARGGAHLIVAGPSGTRGRVWLFEALDNSAPPLGPNPASSCRTVGQWADAAAYNPAAPAPSNQVALIEALDLDTIGVNADADIKAAFLVSDPADPNTLVATPAFAICVTPNGSTFAAEGATVGTAILNMQTRPPFTGVAEVRITRNSGGAPVGISRNVTIAGSAAARIHSK